MGTSIAYAADAYSSTKYSGTIYGTNYEYFAWVDNTVYYAGSAILTGSGSNVPAGYMGAAGHLYNSSGSLCAVSGWQCNGSAAASFSAMTSIGIYYGADYYYGFGYVRAYNGNGYTTLQTASSPVLYF